MIESMMLVLIVYFIFFLFNLKNKDEYENISCYECGFDPNSSTRLEFSYRFFLISILFIIFDVEISLMLPTPFIMESEVGLWVFFFFFSCINCSVVMWMYMWFVGVNRN